MLDYHNFKGINKELVSLVYSIALSYKNNFVDFDDLVQEGFLGLKKAYKNFDPSKNVLFHTYAYYWVKKQILEYIKNNKKLNLTNFDEVGLENLSYEENFDHQQYKENNKINFKKDTIDELEQKVLDLNFNKNLPLDKISKELNIPRERVRQIYNKALRKIKINTKVIES